MKALMRYAPAQKALVLHASKRNSSTALSTTLSMYLCFKGFYHQNLFWNFHIAANPIMLAAARQQKVVSEVVFGMMLQSPRLLASTPPVHQTYALEPTLQGVSNLGKSISGPPLRPATLMNESYMLQASTLMSNQ
eukprot:TRINITY_DN16815_c0_g1_i1.p1 TRINITY_DN16815_c0_g1~~TRINITY_DN16815_c0_g1_i1.p1  ORF type:complete len:135 (+),score=52.67 TRINITY_DN16815_c0_g1_i1:51-455(+)